MHFDFLGFILYRFPIFTDFAFLNWQMLVTVVFAYLWVNTVQVAIYSSNVM